MLPTDDFKPTDGYLTIEAVGEDASPERTAEEEALFARSYEDEANEEQPSSEKPTEGEVALAEPVYEAPHFTPVSYDTKPGAKPLSASQTPSVLPWILGVATAVLICGGVAAVIVRRKRKCKPQ